MEPDWKAKELPDTAPFWEATVSIAAVADGKVYSSHTVGGKAEILKFIASKAQAVLAAWHGQYRSDIVDVPIKRWQPS